MNEIASREYRLNREYLKHRGRRKSYNELARPVDATHPMSFWERNLNKMLNMMLCRQHDHRTKSQQYRIPPRNELEFAPLEFVRKAVQGFTVTWTIWTFRIRFPLAIISFLIFYFVLIFLYALLITIINISYQNNSGEKCLVGWNYSSDNIYAHSFTIAFEISWTTLTTVGFGVVSIPPQARCSLLRFVLASEAFLGLLYSGMCGAMLYAKISRGLSTAHATFSSAICLQYHMEESNHPDESSGRCPSQTSEKKTAFSDTEEITSYPFLEFRVVNDKANYPGGEIMDIEVRCMLISVTLLGSKFEAKSTVADDSFGLENIDHKDNPMEDGEAGLSAFSENRSRVPNVKRVYRKVTLLRSKHPHFSNGAWYLRHTLDRSSPFLSSATRRQLDQLGGWPKSWNNHHEIRKCLNPTIFEIGMIFTGRSNSTVRDVFKVQTWTKEDIYIGWQFVSMSYLGKKYWYTMDDKEKSWKIDLSLLHDIMPQSHGGNEPLGTRTPSNDLVGFIVQQALGDRR